MKIGERGQVTIPKKFREQYGLMPNIEIEFVPDDSGLFIRKKVRHQSPVQQVFGILKKNINTDGYIEQIRGR
jgi:AbrB family looped-hinge helix DNA binding protein